MQICWFISMGFAQHLKAAAPVQISPSLLFVANMLKEWFSLRLVNSKLVSIPSRCSIIIGTLGVVGTALLMCAYHCKAGLSNFLSWATYRPDQFNSLCCNPLNSKKILSGTSHTKTINHQIVSVSRKQVFILQLRQTNQLQDKNKQPQGSFKLQGLKMFFKSGFMKICITVLTVDKTSCILKHTL